MFLFAVLIVCVSAILYAFFGRPKAVQGCSAAPEEFSPTAFLALFLFRGFNVCVRACLRVCVCVCVCVSKHANGFRREEQY